MKIDTKNPLSEAYIQDRKELLGLTPADEAVLGAFHESARRIAAAVVTEFYAFQMEIPAIRALIDEPALLARLKQAMHDYVTGLFEGEYGIQYVSARLRIGRIHVRIGVQHTLYIASLHRLEMILDRHAKEEGATPELLSALHKLFLFDLQLVFDTYIQGLVSEVEESRDRLAAYAETLEDKVAERTAEILRMARTDPLTGLWNRREFYQRLRHEAATARRRDGRLAVVFLDVDEFKSVNDALGHLQGDKLLRQVGQAITATIRESDLAFRYGGDEFCIILPATDGLGAGKLCSVLSAAMPDGVSISCGVAELEPEDGGNFETMIGRADDLMYAAKQAHQIERHSA